jgi:hypothetical protein
MREKVALCLGNRQAARKCRTEKRYGPGRTICPKVRCAWYFDFEPRLYRPPKATQSWRWQMQNGDWPYLGRDAGLEVLHASRAEQVFSLGSAWGGTDEQMIQLYRHTRISVIIFQSGLRVRLLYRGGHMATKERERFTSRLLRCFGVLRLSTPRLLFSRALFTIAFTSLIVKG